MSIWAEIKKAINSNLNKPLNTLIEESKNSLDTTITDYLGNKTYGLSALSNSIKNHYETFPNVTGRSLSTNDTITVTGKGRITFMVSNDSSTGWNFIISEIDNVMVNYYVFTSVNSTKTVVFSIDFEKNISFNRENSHLSVYYIVQLK